MLKVLIFNSAFAATSDIDFNTWLTSYKKFALKKGISQHTLDIAFKNVKFLEKVIIYDRKQPEFYEDTITYVSKRATENRATMASKLLKKNRNLFDEVEDKWIGFWRNSVWITSGWLWWVWLSHDVANIAVYLPRQLSPTLLITVMAYFTILLFYIFYIHGGPIQKVVLDKTGTRYARSATIINVIYAAVLFYFKELNDLPMSTTWVFVGLLCGRELAISTMNKDYKFKYVFPLIGKDFIKMIFGLSVSVGIVLAIHYIIIPNNWF